MYHYTHVFIVILSASSCFCYAGYELFQGFNQTDVVDISITEGFLGSFLDSESGAPQINSQSQKNSTMLIQDQNTTRGAESNPTLTTKSIYGQPVVESTSDIYGDLIETNPLSPPEFACPEDERPSNIGPYEIPTQRDMVLFTRNILLDTFNSYNKQAFYLLKDIRAATRATSSIERRCEGNKIAYRQCVKLVSRQCQQTTKNLVKALENRKEEISNLTKVKICKLSELMADPTEILKSLAQEKVSLEFALPGFLQLLSACSVNCIQSTSVSNYYKNKPLRHMTDQDLVIKHFLTRKNYLELIMDSRHKTTTNSN